MLKRSGFRRKSPQEIAAQWEKKLGKDRVRISKPFSNSTLRQKGISQTTTIKDEIQALERKIAIHRDGGCVLRDEPEAGSCGGVNKKGELILQAEHLITRASNNTYGNMLNIVCLCKHHHINFKPTHSLKYWRLIEKVIGPARWTWLKRNEEYQVKSAIYTGDWKMVKLDLENELKKYEK